MAETARLVSQILETCLKVKEGENVWIQSWDHSVDLASDMASACRKISAKPTVTVDSEENWLRSLTKTSKQQLETLPPAQISLLSKTDVFIFLLGPKKPIDWSKIPEKKRKLADVWYSGSNKYTKQWLAIAKEHGIRMLGIEYCLATHERADTLGLNFDEWKAVMLAGCLANQHEIAVNCEKLAKTMRGRHEVNIQTPFGTYLDFKLIGREANKGDSIVNSEDASRGLVKFLPSGFVEVAPDETSLEGVVVFDAPIRFRGKKIEKLTLKFRRGEVVDFQANTGKEEFENYLKSGNGDVGRFAFFGIGLNPGLRHGFTQDDKVLGGVTLGIGCNEDKGGKNRTSGNAHWWASMTKATVHVDGNLLLKEGQIRL